MGYLETAVVIYLRQLYYPAGFDFPLIPIDTTIGQAEFIREWATMVMLLTMGMLAGKTVSQKFAFFIYCFAVWDIFYYVFLKLMLGWPSSLLTWDILFLIPVPWVGPVIAPCIVSFSMILLTLLIINFDERGHSTRIIAKEWSLLTVGSILVIVSFMWDYIFFVRSRHPETSLWTISGNRPLLENLREYVPVSFNWGIFLAGELLILLAIFIIYKRFRSQAVNEQ